VRDRVACYPHIEEFTPEAMATAAQAKVADGWRFVRFHLPEREGPFDRRRAVRDCVAHVTAVREAVGEEIEILIDVHTRLDSVDAITLCREIEPLRPYFVEDPIRSENRASLARLDAKIGVPIAMGEQYASKWEFAAAIENEWIDYARIDVCNVGGLTEAMKVAHWCETHSIDIAPHNPLGPVSTAACLHMDLAISNFGVQEVARPPGEVLPELFPRQAPFESGHLLPPSEPGLGIELNEAAIKEYPIVEGGDCPRRERPDGSFTNW
jgi:galactonate dehydratase